MTSWFALYYVPPADSNFYRLGSEVLGYDVRQGKRLERSSGFENKLGDIPTAWTADARDFGFHMTITEALTYVPGTLEAIEQEIADILGSFNPESEMTLAREGLVQWKEGEVWVLRYAPSRALELLQAVLVARLAKFGQTSMFFEEIEQHPERYAEPYERRRLKTFLSPRGLDTWPAHFTLLNPHPREKNEGLAAAFEEMFGEFGRLEATTFSLMRKEGDAPWQLYRDYPWPPLAKSEDR